MTAPNRNRHPPYFARMYEGSSAATFGLSFDQFAEVLLEVRQRYFPTGATSSETRTFYESLRLEDLVLAIACTEGSEHAWECFVGRYRRKLYEMARAITKDESTGRQLADSIYGDLFGTRQLADGRRVSKLASYTGRGSLEGWLRTVLAQEYVNLYRKHRNLVSFDEAIAAPERIQTSMSTQNAADPRLEDAIGAALREATPDERMLLAAYYLDERTLAEIARMLRVHESTVSRRLDKTLSRVNKRIAKELRRAGMSAREVEEAMRTGARDLDVNVRATLLDANNLTARKGPVNVP